MWGKYTSFFLHFLDSRALLIKSIEWSFICKLNPYLCQMHNFFFLLHLKIFLPFSFCFRFFGWGGISLDVKLMEFKCRNNANICLLYEYFKRTISKYTSSITSWKISAIPNCFPLSNSSKKILIPSSLHSRCQSFLQASYIKSKEFFFRFSRSTQKEEKRKKSSFNFSSNIIHEESEKNRHRYFTICWCTSKSFHPFFFEAIFYTESNRIRTEVDFVDTSYQILSVSSICTTAIDNFFFDFLLPYNPFSI